MVDHTWETELSFEQILYALAMGVKGAVTPVGATDKTWTYAPAAGGGDTIDSFTIEKRFTDGTTSYDREYPYTMAKSIEISGEVNGVAKMKVEMFSKQEDASTLTPAIAAPTAWEIPVVNLGKVFIDPTGANIGVTPITGQIHYFTWKLTTGLDRRFYMDGALAMSRHSRQKRLVELTIRMDVGTPSQALRAAITSRAKQFVRVQLLGTNAVSLPRTINLDGCYVMQPAGAEATRDGDDIIEMKMVSRYDATWAKDFQVIVINALAALP